MTARQEFSAIGRAVLIAREGRRLTAYRDSVNVLTIGIGHTSAAGPPLVTPGLKITSAECDAAFAKDVEKFAQTVREVVKAPLADHEFDACVSLCFNIGQGGFARSTVVKRLDAHDYGGAADAMLMWNKPAEIVARRQAEAKQFRTPYVTALPMARINDAKPIAVAAPSTSTVVPHPAASAPVIEPVVLPVPLSWLARAGAWFDRVMGATPA